ncbi:MAG: hypothetical protein SFW67_16000 [Myxococcaceae bacterium]|nr:hypothetical protein [Myxococcaceae bacterium]
MSTRAREHQTPPDVTEATADVAPVDLEASEHRLDSFPVLVQALGAASPAVRRELAGEINDVLIAMRFPGHETEEAELVMQALGSKVLHELVDAQGRSCRREAVETMMAAGFPHALLLEADDIAFAREYQPPASATAGDGSTLQPWERSARDARRIGATIIAAGQVVTANMLALSEGTSLGVWLAMGLAFLVALVLAARLAFVRPRRLNMATTGTLGFVTMLIPLLVAVLSNLGVAGVASLGLGLGLFVAVGQQFSRLRDEPPPREWRLL